MVHGSGSIPGPAPEMKRMVTSCDFCKRETSAELRFLWAEGGYGACAGGREDDMPCECAL